MSEADIKIAAYRDAIDLCLMLADTMGPVGVTACRVIVAKLEDRIEEVMDRECHRQVVATL